jgi:GDP-D-mannose dehydratase
VDSRRFVLHYGDLSDSSKILRIIQQVHSEDYVIATVEQCSVREFCSRAFREVGIDIEWRGKGFDFAPDGLPIAASLL